MKALTVLRSCCLFFICILLLFNTGCETLAQQRRRDEMREREDKRLAQETTRRMEGRVETLEFEIERLMQELNQVRNDAQDAGRMASESLEPRIAAVENKTAALEKLRVQDRQEIVDSLSRKMVEIMQKTGASSGGRTRRGGSEYGYEHTVNTGETLSEISSAYGVSVQRIMEENNIKNPNKVRVGQLLFIPE